MAHFAINRSKPAGAELASDLRTFRDVKVRLRYHMLVMAQYEGANDMAGMEEAYGLDGGDGPSVKGEIDAAIGRITTDDPVTGVHSALEQLFVVVG